MNQLELHRRVSRDSNVAPEVVKRVLQSHQDVIARALAADESVTQTNFFGIYVVEKNERSGRNPHTGESITIPARRIIRVIFSERLLEIVRSGTTEIDGRPVTLRKLPKGAKGIIPVVTADPSAHKLRVRAPKSPVTKRSSASKTA